MSEYWPPLLILCIGLLIQYYRVSSRRKNDYREIIEGQLHKNGYKFLSSTTPKMFDVGPFPKVEFEVGGIQTKTPFGRGESTEYRVVRYLNTYSNKEHEAWVKLDFKVSNIAARNGNQN